jgi:hypothetical protein
MNRPEPSGSSIDWLAENRTEPYFVPGKGRGVRATVPLAADDIILRDCTIPLSASDCIAVIPTAIEDYYFAHPDDPAQGLMVLGLASLCNHSDDPSAHTVIERDAALGWIVTLVATRDIRPGDEITRRYACPPWFEVSE